MIVQDPSGNVARAAAKAASAHRGAHYISPGQYKVHSRSGGGWYIQQATATPAGDITIRCSCKGGEQRQDTAGNSLCWHTCQVSARLARNRSEADAVRNLRRELDGPCGCVQPR